MKRLQIFLSHSSHDRQQADEISLQLEAQGHAVFFDRSDLVGGEDYGSVIREQIARADLFIFLITPSSVAPGAYTLSELRMARDRWPHPANRVLPVLLLPTKIDDIPTYLRSVTLFQPEGNAAAEIAALVNRLGAKPGRRLKPMILAAVGVAVLLAVLVVTRRKLLDSGASAPPTPQTSETRADTAPHAPNIEINRRYTLWEEQLMQFALEPGASKVIKGADLYARVATYPESSCAGPGLVPYTWQVRVPYPAGGDLEIRRVLMGGKTERAGLGSMGSGTMSVCDEHIFKNNGTERIYVEVRYASAADLSR